MYYIDQEQKISELIRKLDNLTNEIISNMKDEKYNAHQRACDSGYLEIEITRLLAYDYLLDLKGITKDFVETKNKYDYYCQHYKDYGAHGFLSEKKFKIVVSALGIIYYSHREYITL